MIGHSVLHGGPGFSGLSFPVVKLLTGRHRDTAASALTLQDCPDLDHRETIALVSSSISKFLNVPMSYAYHNATCFSHMSF